MGVDLVGDVKLLAMKFFSDTDKPDKAKVKQLDFALLVL